MAPKLVFACGEGEYKVYSTRGERRCCIYSEKKEIMEQINKCLVSTLGSVTSNTKYQDYDDVPKACADVVYNTYCFKR